MRRMDEDYSMNPAPPASSAGAAGGAAGSAACPPDSGSASSSGSSSVSAGSASSGSAVSSSASSTTSGRHGSASRGTQTPTDMMIEMEDIESGEREPLLKREGGVSASVSIESGGVRAGESISFSQLSYPYNPHQQGYGSAGSSTPPPSSASAASSVSPPPPAVNEETRDGARSHEEGERDGSPILQAHHHSRDASVASCSTVNEIVMREAKAPAQVPGRPFTATNRDYSFLNQQTISPMYASSMSLVGGHGGPRLLTAAEPESEKLRKMKAKKAKKESSKSANQFTVQGDKDEYDMNAVLASLGVEEEQSKKGSGSASSLKKSGSKSKQSSASAGSLSGQSTRRKTEEGENGQPASSQQSGKASVSRKNSSRAGGLAARQASPVSSQEGSSQSANANRQIASQSAASAACLPTSASSIELSTEREGAVVVEGASASATAATPGNNDSLEEGLGLKVSKSTENLSAFTEVTRKKQQKWKQRERGGGPRDRLRNATDQGEAVISYNNPHHNQQLTSRTSRDQLPMQRSTSHQVTRPQGPKLRVDSGGGGGMGPLAASAASGAPKRASSLQPAVTVTAAGAVTSSSPTSAETQSASTGNAAMQSQIADNPLHYASSAAGAAGSSTGCTGCIPVAPVSDDVPLTTADFPPLEEQPTWPALGKTAASSDSKQAVITSNNKKASEKQPTTNKQPPTSSNPSYSSAVMSSRSVNIALPNANHNTNAQQSSRQTPPLPVQSPPPPSMSSDVAAASTDCIEIGIADVGMADPPLPQQATPLSPPHQTEDTSSKQVPELKQQQSPPSSDPSAQPATSSATTTMFHPANPPTQQMGPPPPLGVVPPGVPHGVPVQAMQQAMQHAMHPGMQPAPHPHHQTPAPLNRAFQTVTVQQPGMTFVGPVAAVSGPPVAPDIQFMGPPSVALLAQGTQQAHTMHLPQMPVMPPMPPMPPIALGLPPMADPAIAGYGHNPVVLSPRDHPSPNLQDLHISPQVPPPIAGAAGGATNATADDVSSLDKGVQSAGQRAEGGSVTSDEGVGSSGDTLGSERASPEPFQQLSQHQQLQNEHHQPELPQQPLTSSQPQPSNQPRAASKSRQNKQNRSNANKQQQQRPSQHASLRYPPPQLSQQHRDEDNNVGNVYNHDDVVEYMKQQEAEVEALLKKNTAKCYYYVPGKTDHGQ